MVKSYITKGHLTWGILNLFLCKWDE